MPKRTNEMSWFEKSTMPKDGDTSKVPETITIADGIGRPCVFVETSDNFHFCNLEDVEMVFGEIRRRLKVQISHDQLLNTL